MLSRNFELYIHALDMLDERLIPEEWVMLTIDYFDRTEVGPDNNVHYVKSAPEFGDRILRVIVNPHVNPNRIVTFFFDRRLRTTL